MAPLSHAYRMPKVSSVSPVICSNEPAVGPIGMQTGGDVTATCMQVYVHAPKSRISIMPVNEDVGSYHTVLQLMADLYARQPAQRNTRNIENKQISSTNAVISHVLYRTIRSM